MTAMYNLYILSGVPTHFCNTKKSSENLTQKVTTEKLCKYLHMYNICSFSEIELWLRKRCNTYVIVLCNFFPFDLSGTVRVSQAVGEEQKFSNFQNFIWDDALASRHYFGTKSFDGKCFVWK